MPSVIHIAPYAEGFALFCGIIFIIIGFIRFSLAVRNYREHRVKLLMDYAIEKILAKQTEFFQQWLKEKQSEWQINYRVGEHYTPNPKDINDLNEEIMTSTPAFMKKPLTTSDLREKLETLGQSVDGRTLMGEDQKSFQKKEWSDKMKAARNAKKQQETKNP